MGKREVFFDGKTLMIDGKVGVVHIREMANIDPMVKKAGNYRTEGKNVDTPSI